MKTLCSSWLSRSCAKKIIFISGKEVTTLTCILFSIAAEMMHRDNEKLLCNYY